MKILFVATVRSHIGQFHMPLINRLVEAGHCVEAAFKDNSSEKKGLDLSSISKTFEVPFERSPFKFSNISAFFKLKKIINEGNYDIIHCHTPMGAVLTRLAAITARKKGTKVFYTAHGFHFYKGCSKKNWLVFYPIEKFLSRFTDCLILINNEDFELAINKRFAAKKIIKTHGVGVDNSKFSKNIYFDEKVLKEKLGIEKDDLVLMFTADLCNRKNQQMLLYAVATIKNIIPNVKLLLPGQPTLLEEFQEIVNKLNIDDNVKFLGYRRDIPELLFITDFVVSSSKQEGLPINLVEAMSMSKPMVVTDVRGNSDLIEDGKGGYLIELNNHLEMANKIIELHNNQELCLQMGKYNLKAAEKFYLSNVLLELKSIYNDFGCEF